MPNYNKLKRNVLFPNSEGYGGFYLKQIRGEHSLNFCPFMSRRVSTRQQCDIGVWKHITLRSELGDDYAYRVGTHLSYTFL